jgi:penicillin-binding protein 2
MVAVVNEDGGTGGNARVDGSRMQIAGKTGTSQVSRRSSEASQSELRWEERDHALFVAYYPAARPRYALSVIVEHGGGGGATAAPLARELIELLIDRDPAARPAYRAAGRQEAVPPTADPGRAATEPVARRG